MSDALEDNAIVSKQIEPIVTTTNKTETETESDEFTRKEIMRSEEFRRRFFSFKN
jgi:hypothetical protein